MCAKGFILKLKMIYFINSLLIKLINIRKIHLLTSIQSSSLNLIAVGKNSYISAFSTIITTKNKKNASPIILADGVHIKSGCYILSGSGPVSIGKGTQVGAGVKILGGGGVTIGKNVRIGPNTVIASSSHDKVINKTRSEKFEPVHIKDNVFIGANCTVLSNCIIEEGVTIGAGSVLTKNIEEAHAVFCGIPARKIQNHTNILTSIEEDIESFLRQVPFHNLFYLYDIVIPPSHYGGTCTDRTKHFKQIIDEKYTGCGITTAYHRACIGDKETHTILKITIGDRIYFADVGMGFPLMRLIPADTDLSYQAMGITFQSLIDGEYIVVKSNINPVTSNMDSEKMHVLMKFKINSEHSQAEIFSKMEKRFEHKEKIPFLQRGLRYMFICEDTFYMIKHDEPTLTREYAPKHVTEYSNNANKK